MFEDFSSLDTPNGAIRPKFAVEFIHHPTQDEEKSKAAGRPIFKDEEHFVFYKPGGEIFQRVATQEDRISYPVEYARFQQQHAKISEGTPISLWADSMITPALVQELAAIGVRTLEQLVQCKQIEGDDAGQKLIEAAQLYLSGGDKTKELQKLRDENYELKMMNNDLKKQIEQIKKSLKAEKKKEE